jgi:hypothetical protein
MNLRLQMKKVCILKPANSLFTNKNAESSFDSTGKLSSTGMSESLSLHDNSVSRLVENDEDTDAQEFTSDDDATTQKLSTAKKTIRRSSAPASLSSKKEKGKNKSQTSPFDAGRLSSISVGGARSLQAPNSTPTLNDVSQLTVEEPDFGDMGGDDDHEFGDDFDWRATPGSSAKGSHRKSAASAKSTGKKSGSAKSSKTPHSAPKTREETEDDETETVVKSKKNNKRRVSYASEVSTMSTPGSSEFPRGRALPDDSYREEDTGEYSASLPWRRYALLSAHYLLVV